MVPNSLVAMQPFTEQNMSDAREAARAGDADRMRNCISATALSNNFGELTALDMITDADGNTLLHIAALHGHITCIREIQLCFQKSHGRLTENMQRFAMQPNKIERNTALHLPARHENLDILQIAICRKIGGTRHEGSYRPT